MSLKSCGIFLGNTDISSSSNLGCVFYGCINQTELGEIVFCTLQIEIFFN